MRSQKKRKIIRGKQRPKRRPQLEKPTCHCGEEMALRSSTYGNFWGCTNYPKCDGIVGCHPDNSPLGTPADKETRQLRQVAHEVFDNWWPTQFGTRGEAYEWMEENAPKPHIADMNYGECEELIEMLEEES